MKKLLLALAGVAFAVLAAIGLVLPIFPGFVFLLAAAACFAALSPALRRRMDKQPRIRRFLHRLDASSGMALLPRLKLALWAGVETIIPARK